MKQSLSTARHFLSFFEIIGWVAVVFGVLLLVWAASQSALQMLVVAIALSGGGFVQIVFTQIARAQIETAENSAVAVDLLRNIHKTLQRHEQPAVSSGEGNRPVEAPAAYRPPANQIPKDNNGLYVVGDRSFVSLEDAQNALKRSRRP